MIPLDIARFADSLTAEELFRLADHVTARNGMESCIVRVRYRDVKELDDRAMAGHLSNAEESGEPFTVAQGRDRDCRLDPAHARSGHTIERVVQAVPRCMA